MPTNLRSPSITVGFALTVLASLVTACTFVDEEPRIPFEPLETDDGSDGLSECLMAVEQVQSACEAPQQLFFMLDEAASMVPVDDPTASTQVGPNGWLVQVPSASHYVGTQHFDDGHCTAGCGWCQPGQSLCHSGSEATDVSGCVLCMPWDTPDAEAQCTQLVEACVGADDEGDTGSDEPLDEPVPDETGLGSTGSEGESSSTGSGTGSAGSGSAGSDSDADGSGSGHGDSGSTGSADSGCSSSSTGDSGSERGLDETGC